DPVVEKYEPRLAIYASGADESAIALHGDKASRLALALFGQLKGGRATVDVVGIVVAIADQLNEDGVIRGQRVSYRMHGSSIQLSRGPARSPIRRERTVAIVRNALIGTGAVAALVAVWAGWYYWSHTIIEISFGGL